MAANSEGTLTVEICSFQGPMCQALGTLQQPASATWPLFPCTHILADHTGLACFGYGV